MVATLTVDSFETSYIILTCWGYSPPPPGIPLSMALNNYMDLKVLILIIIKSNHFPLLEETWTANEEIQMLNALLDCGVGNW